MTRGINHLPFLFPRLSPSFFPLLQPLSRRRGVERWGGPEVGRQRGDIKNSLRLVAHQQGRDMTPEEEKGGVDNDEEYQT